VLYEKVGKKTGPLDEGRTRRAQRTNRVRWEREGEEERRKKKRSVSVRLLLKSGKEENLSKSRDAGEQL